MSVTLSSPCAGSTTRPPFNTRSFILPFPVVLSAAKDLIAACKRHEILRFAQDDNLPVRAPRACRCLSHPAHGFRQCSGARQGDAFEAEPVGHQAQLLAQRTRDLSCFVVRLEMRRVD